MLLADSSTHISVIIGSIKTNLDIVEMVTFCITQTLAPFCYNICFRGSDLYFNPNSIPLAITDLPAYSDTVYSDTPLTVTLLACHK